MTGRERTLRALAFEPVDRPPVAGGLLNNWELLAEVAEAQDFWGEPRRHVFEAFRRMGCDAILGPVMPKSPEQMTEGHEGRSTGFSKVATPDPICTPEGVAERARKAPSPSEVRAGIDQGAWQDEYAAMMVNGQREAGEMLYIPHCLGWAPHFPTSTGTFDYEAFLMACVLHTEELAHLFASWAESSQVRFEAVARATVEHDLLRLIWVGTDLCSRRGPMLSPSLFRQLYFPPLARAIEPLRNADIKVVWHCDANYTEILDDLIDLGIDGFQGFYEEPGGIELENLAKLRARSGELLILFGGMSTVTTLPRGTAEEVRAAVDRCVRLADERGGGMLIAPSSSIGPEAPSEDVMAMYEHAGRVR